MHSEPSPPRPTKTTEFGSIHVAQPQTEHFQTIVFLHGRGSTGEEFAEELFASNLSSGNSLRDAFPGCRWVFPSSKEFWNSIFLEEMPAWFEAPSLTDTAAGQDLQAPGIRDSVAYVCRILDDEISLVGGRPERVVLGGISQGGAIAMWTLLCHNNARARGLCAFVGASTWLPFAAEIEATLSKRPMRPSAQTTAGDFHDFVLEMIGPLRDDIYRTGRACHLLKTPVFMGHGLDDAYVDMGLGKEATDVLSSTGFNVEWKSYCGAEQEGHWLKVPEQVDDIRAFLAGAMSKGK